MSLPSRIDFITHVAKAASEGRLVLFVGAGVSKASGLPLWSELLQPIIHEFYSGQQVPVGIDLAAVADAYVEKQRGGQERLRRHVVTTIQGAAAKLNDIHIALPNLRPRAVFTTNYDDLLVEAFKGHNPRRIVGHQDAEYSDFADELPIYHLHGHIDSPSSLVLTKSEYLSYAKDQPGFMKKFESHLAQYEVLFLGYSGGDEHFEQLSFLVQQHCPKLAKGHYAVALSADDPMTEFNWKRFNANVFALGVPQSEATSALAALIQEISQNMAPSPTVAVKRSAYQGLTTAVARYIDRDLGEISALIREDCLHEAEERLLQMKTPGTWEQLSSGQKSTVYRNLIQIALRRRDDAKEAEALIIEAETECPDQRFIASRAELARTKSEAKEFLASYPEPNTAFEWRWKLVLMLACGQNAEVLVELTSPPSNIVPDVQSQTLAAWAHLGLRDLEAAFRANEEVLAANPRWAGNLELQALMLYWRSIASVWADWLHTGLPIPAPLCAIIAGPESLSRLQRAADSFEHLASLADAGNEVSRRMKAWQLASLILRWRAGGCAGNDPFKTRAERLVNEMLTISDAAPLAVAWANYANIHFDVDATLHALRLRAEDGDLPSADAVATSLIKLGRIAEAAEEFDKHESIYARHDALDGWRFHRVQLAHELDDDNTITKILHGVPDGIERLRLEAAIAKLRAARAKDLKQALPAVRALGEASSQIIDLFGAADDHLEAGEPQFVLDHADLLLVQLPSLDTFELVANAAMKAEQWKRCLELVDSHLFILPEGHAHMSALKLKADCLSKLHQPHEAAALAQKIASLSNKPSDVISWFELARDAGDIQVLAQIASLLHSNEKAPPGHKLHVARHIHAMHPHLASALLDDVLAIQETLTPQESVAAWHLASRLGKESGLSDLLAKGAVPGGPLVPVHGFEHMKEMLLAGRDQTQKHETEYAEGKMPVHIFAHLANEPLSRIIDRAIPERESMEGYSPSRMWSYRMRHGSRQNVLQLPNARLSLFLDITSLLVLHRFGVLDVVRDHSESLILSPFVPAVLVHEIEQLGDRQLSVFEKHEQLIKEVETGRLKVILGDQQATEQRYRRRDGGAEAHAFALNQHVLVDFWPPLSETTSETHEAARRTGLGGLLAAMVKAGWLRAKDAEKASTSHSSFVEPGPEVSIEPGSTVVLAPSMASCLMDVGWLDELMSRCEVWISSWELNEAKAVHRRREEDTALMDRLEQLRQWVIDGQSKGWIVYRQHDSDLGDDHPLSHCWVDCVDLKREASVWTVSDDRWLTSRKRVGQSTIVGSLEIFQWLRTRDAITESQHHQSLLRLRLGNCRYIPLTVRELMYHLQRGVNSQTGEFKETRELAILRKHVAAMMLDQRFLQVSADPAHVDVVELHLGIGLAQVIPRAMGKVWSSHAKIETKQAQGQWLLDALSYDPVNLRAAYYQNAVGSAQPTAWDGGLFIGACMALLDSLPGSKRIHGLLEMTPWLAESLAGHPSRHSVLAEEIGYFVEQMSGDNDDPDARKHVLTRFKAILANLPTNYDLTDSLSPLARDALELRTVTKLGDTEFLVSDLWPAVEKALSNEGPIIQSCDEPPESYELRKADGDSVGLRLEFIAKDGKSFSVTDDVLTLAHPDPAERLKFLEGTRQELDLRTDDSASLFSEIVSLPMPQDRVERYLLLREHSVRVQFADLERQFQQKQSIHTQDLLNAAKPLGVDAMLRHARLPEVLGDTPSSDVFEATATALISESDFRTTFFVFASLPRTLPSCVVESFEKLSANERGELVNEVCDHRGSPIHRLHLANLLIKRTDTEVTKALELLEQLASPEMAMRWRFHGALLLWAHHNFVSSASSGDESARLCACWLFAGVFQTWLGSPTQLAEVTSEIERAAGNNRELFGVAHYVDSDISSPLGFSGRRVLAFGLPNLLTIDDYSEDTKERLRAIVRSLTFGSGEESAPQGTILHLQSIATNRLGSFVGRASLETLRNWLSPDEAEWLSVEGATELLRAWCSESVSETRHGDAMSGVSALGSGMSMPLSVREDVGAMIGRFTFKGLEHWDSRRLLAVARFVFLQSAWLRPDDEGFWHGLFKEFCDTMIRSNGATQENKDVDLLLDAAHHLSLSRPNVPSRASQFAKLALLMCEEHPQTAANLWHTIASMLTRVGIECQRSLWMAVTELRAQ